MDWSLSMFRLLTELWKEDAQGLVTPHPAVPAKSQQPRAESRAAVTGTARPAPDEVEYKLNALVQSCTAGALLLLRPLRTYVAKSGVGMWTGPPEGRT